jgi:hypothetical protein
LDNDLKDGDKVRSEGKEGDWEFGTLSTVLVGHGWKKI